MKQCAWILLAAGCGHAAPCAAPPARADLRGAVYVAEFGLRATLDECVEQAAMALKSGDLERATWLAGQCHDAEADAAEGMARAVGLLDSGKPVEVRALGCALRGSVRAFDRLLEPLERRGFVSGAADDGAAETRWLVRFCPPQGDRP